MITIVSPTPRHASPNPEQPLERPISLQSPPIYLPSELPRSSGLFSPPRLMSPINLSSGPVHKANLFKASAPCSSSKRRRLHPTTSRTTHRRHCTRSDCVTYVNGIHAFDKLPWISQIESQSPETADAWDVTDLSLLPDPPSSGIGPVRNRRSSSSSARASVTPFGGTLAGPGEATTMNMGHVSSGLRSRRELLPLQLLPAADSEALDPRTPPPNEAHNPYEVTFRNLMPAFPPVGDTRRTASSRLWANDSSPLLPSPM